MKRLLMALALLALPLAAEATNHWEQSHYLSSAWGEVSEAGFDGVTLGFAATDSNGAALDTLYSNADTLGPVFVGRCKKVLAAAAWTGDSTNVTIETSIDRIHWVAVTNAASAAQAGTASTYGLYFTRVLEPTTANVTASAGGSVTANSNLGYAHWLRMRLKNNSVWGARTTTVSARFSCM